MYSNNFNRGFPNNFNMYNDYYNFSNLNYNNMSSNRIPKQALLSKITNGTSWNAFLNNTSKTLNVINQAIPIVNQARPLIRNLRTMFVIADIIKEDNNEKKDTSKKKVIESAENQPTFFL